MKKSFTVTWPRCGHGVVKLTECDGNVAITVIERPVNSESEAKAEREKLNAMADRMAEREVGATVSVDALGNCPACEESGRGRRHLRPGEQVSRHAVSGALPAK